jgi:hypothetical protein
MDIPLRRRGGEAASMKISFGRWILGTAIACAALAVVILPADGSRGVVSWLDVQRRSPEDEWQTRMYARQRHLYDVASAYRSAREFVAAQHAFAAEAGRVGAPEARFADDVPPSMRVAFNRALDDERVQKGELTGRGKVGVFVMVDTAVRVNGMQVPTLRRGSDGTVTRVFPPAPLTGDRCMVIVGIPGGDAWSKIFEGKPVGPVHPLLDACGFYDSFGAPGATVARELVDAQYFFARGFTTAIPPDTTMHPLKYAWQTWWGQGTRDARCLAGNDTACLDQWMGRPESDDQLYRHPSPEPPGGSSLQAIHRNVRSISPLNRVAAYVGPQRFERMWQSPKPLEESFLAETGEPLADFIRSGDQAELGAYHPGPWTAPFSAGLTLIVIGGGFGLTSRFSKRPHG